MNQNLLLHQIFEATAKKYPQQIALDIPPLSTRPRICLTYKELDRMANYLAGQIAPFVKANSETVIALLLERNSHHLFVAQLAALKAGAAYCSIDSSFPAERISFILDDSKTPLILTTESLRQLLPNGYHTIDVANALTNIANDKTYDFVTPTWVLANNLAYIIYTSGTTGKPKGVACEHRNIVNLIQADVDYFKLSSSERISQNSSTSYDSSLEEIWMAWAIGATVVVATDEIVRSGPDFGAWLKKEKITVICPPPTLLKMKVATNPKVDLPDLKLVYVGGEALPREIADLWGRDLWLENGYGPTECTVTVTRTRIFPQQAISIGRPVKNNFALILDEKLNELKIGEIGELCIGGAQLTRGYLHRPELTNEKFITHPLHGRIYRTGDLASKNADDEIFYHGRADSQVKLRGYRIELGDIESAISTCENVAAAACKVQESRAGQRLIAYLVSKDNCAVDLEKIKSTLEKNLPKYMIPSLFMQLSKLPLLATSGKLDRKALPDPEENTNLVDRKIIAPSNEIETIILQAWQATLLSQTKISTYDNFFEIGGDSLGAAITISHLRKNPQTSSITVRDLYQHPTIAALAASAILNSSPSDHSNLPPFDFSVKKDESSDWALLVTVAQIAWILAGIMMAAIVGHFFLIYLFPIMLAKLGAVLLFFLIPLMAPPLFLLYATSSILFAIVIKKLLIGKYRSGKHPVWGLFYLRHWIVQQSVKLVPIGTFEGTELLNFFLRMMGAKIGKNVFFAKGADVILGAWDLLEIGNNVSIGRDAAVRTVSFNNGSMLFGKVKIGNNCTIETRASISLDCHMEDDSYLTHLSMIPPGTTLLRGEKWEGVPAKRIGLAPPAQVATDYDHEMSACRYAWAMILARAIMSLITSLPVSFSVLGIMLYFNINTEVVTRWFTSSKLDDIYLFELSTLAVLASLLALPMQALYSRLLGKIIPGNYSLHGTTFIKIWLKDRLVELAGNRLSGALYWPYWLRLAGMKVGKNCEISTIIDVTPELIDIGDEVFFADGIYLGGPTIHRGVATIDEVHLSKNSFIGNHAIIPSGTKLPSDILLGICTVADEEKVKQGTSWFGHPSFELPRREVVQCDRSLTHRPSWDRFITRLFWETLRFFLPVIPTLTFILWSKLAYHFSTTQSSIIYFSSTLHLITIGLFTFMASLIFVLKWVLLGKVRPGQHPLWSCWCSRWDFLYVAWAAYAQRILVFFEGTLLLSWWLRAMGATVGKRVILGAGFAQVVDPDMLNFEDYATVLCMFQAHTFEDRVLKIAPIHIKAGSSLGNASVLLYGAEIGQQAHVCDNSVVMKHEYLVPGQRYIGCPTQNVKKIDGQYFYANSSGQQ